MPDNNEVIAERVGNLKETLEKHIGECDYQHKDMKTDIGEIHRRVDKILEAVQGQVLLDQKVNTLAAHVQNIESTIKDYPTTKQHADSAKSALEWVGRLVVGAVITAILALVVVSK